MALAGLLLISGCAAGEPEADSSRLVLGTPMAPVSFAASAGEWANRAPFYEAVYDTLLRIDPEGTIVPNLATEWSYNDDNTVLTLALREDVLFTDGSAFNAEVAKENLERFKNGVSPAAGHFTTLESVETTGEYSVELTLSEPNPALLIYLATDPGLQQSAESFDNPDLETNPVGSGPYVLDTAATVTNSTYVFTKNEGYWDPDRQVYDEIVINVYTDPTAVINVIKAGEANGVILPNNSGLAEVENAGWTINAHELDVAGLYLWDRGGALAPELADIRVRQAINHAFDREALLQGLESGYGSPTTQLFPERSVAYDPELDEMYPYDPELAKDLLAEAGYPNGFTLSMPSSSLFNPALLTLMSQQLADIGITVEYTDTGNNFIADLFAQKYPASYMTLQQQADWPHIQFLLSATAQFNLFGVDDPVADELIRTIQYGTDAERDDALRALNRLTVENAWHSVWYRVQGSYATDPTTVTTMQPGTPYPSIFSFHPAD
jgi:peptide/nickel transport system substrate-binding protein